MTIEQMHTLVKLGAAAGREETLLARVEQRDAKIVYDISLAHILRTEIQRLEITIRDYDYAVALFTNVYAETIRNFEPALKEHW